MEEIAGELEEACIIPNGERAESGPGATEAAPSSSGFGGLGLEGMVGMSEPVGVGRTPPGEGKRGAMSGDTSWKGDREDGDGDGERVAGEEERVGICVWGCEEDRESRGVSMRVREKRGR